MDEAISRRGRRLICSMCPCWAEPISVVELVANGCHGYIERSSGGVNGRVVGAHGRFSSCRETVGSVAQSVEHRPFKPWVLGSSPSAPNFPVSCPWHSSFCQVLSSALPGAVASEAAQLPDSADLPAAFPTRPRNMPCRARLASSDSIGRGCRGPRQMWTFMKGLKSRAKTMERIRRLMSQCTSTPRMGVARLG